jgi:hypothetical protein
MIDQKKTSWAKWALMSLLFASAASAQILYHNIWYDLFQPRLWLMDLVETLLLPLWIVATAMAFTRFPASRKRLWWLLLPAPVCLLPLIEFLFTIFAWSSHGFAP